MKHKSLTIRFRLMVMLVLLLTLPGTAGAQALETYGGDGPVVHIPPATAIEAADSVIKIEAADSVINGDFELGNLSGWGLYRAGNTTGWSAYSGTIAPQSGHTIAAPPQGTWAATSHQLGPNVQILYQDITLNCSYELNFILYSKNWAGTYYSPASLSYNSGFPNQQYRVDIMNPAAPLLSVAPADVLLNIFQTMPGDPMSIAPTPYSADLSPWAGQTIRLRFAEVDNQWFYNGSVDDIRLSQLNAHEPWSFVHITDPHIGSRLKILPLPHPCSTIDMSAVDLDAAIYQISKEEPKPELILVTGDLTHYSCVGADCTGHYQRYLESIQNAIDDGIAVYSVPGNHDRRTWPGLFEWYCDCGLCCYDTPSGVTLLGGPGNYHFYHEEHEELLFVGLDSGKGFPLSDEGLTTSQIDALQNLDNCIPKIVFMHHPGVDVDDGSIPIDTDVSIGYDTEDEDFRDWCQHSNVRLVLAGHSHQDHVYDRTGEELEPTSTVRPLYIQTPATVKDLPWPIDQDDEGYRVIRVQDGEAYPESYTETSFMSKLKTIIASLCSPGNLHVYDSSANHVGILSSGEAERGIPGSFYHAHYVVSTEDGDESFSEMAVVFDAFDDYLYEVVGTEEGTYGLYLVSASGGESITFEATEIPTLPGAKHVYAVDWSALSAGEEGVVLGIDADGDGVFERTAIADEDLTSDEFTLQTETVVDFDPDVLNLRSPGKLVTAYIELPEGFDVSNIDVSSVKLNDSVAALLKPVKIGDNDEDGIADLMVKFDRRQVAAVLERGEQIVNLSGRLADGTLFAGIDTIRVFGSTDSETAGDEFDMAFFEWMETEETAAFTLLEAGETIDELDPGNFSNEDAAAALANEINAALWMMNEGLLNEALDVLGSAIMERTNGCADVGEPDEDDWITSCEGQGEVYPLVLEAIELLESLM